MNKIYQHWDRLLCCVVGQTYPPEFYSWIKNSRVRSAFETLADETEEDYQKLIKILKSFDVEILRPKTVSDHREAQLSDGKFLPPPMQPRNHLTVVGNTLWENILFSWSEFYRRIKDPSWPDISEQEIKNLSPSIQQEIIDHGYPDFQKRNFPWQDLIFSLRPSFSKIQTVDDELSSIINGAMITRIGLDLYFATDLYCDDINSLKTKLSDRFPDYRVHVIDIGGHSDGVFCPVVPGLIISSHEPVDYQTTFPDWEVLHVKNDELSDFAEWRKLKKKNHGKWWIPGYENDQSVTDTVELWLNNWVGYVEESVFDVNMLVIDQNNVVVCRENDEIFRAFARYNITPHLVNFRHRWFWDGGLHCMTCDLDRDSVMQDYFPKRHNE